MIPWQLSESRPGSGPAAAGPRAGPVSPGDTCRGQPRNESRRPGRLGRQPGTRRRGVLVGLSELLGLPPGAGLASESL